MLVIPFAPKGSFAMAMCIFEVVRTLVEPEGFSVERSELGHGATLSATLGACSQSAPVLFWGEASTQRQACRERKNRIVNSAGNFAILLVIRLLRSVFGHTGNTSCVLGVVYTSGLEASDNSV